ncbi:SMC-Scp complex subunit ScpB [Nesterenkonia alba]|uniref:SMC-Scp complex subunit ScpB n=1 Tax=Nesterenkonia alba TaxID=515814 RepID=UPI0003B3AB87|nr:SMC-Scp complex subunit ScpB [Nesterenkonia alba]
MTEEPRAAAEDSQPAPTPAPALEEAQGTHLVAHEDYLAAVEAVLMVAEEPVTPAELAAAVNLPVHQVQALLDELRAEADGTPLDWPGEQDTARAPRRQRGYELREVAGGWRFYSRSRYAEQVSAFVLGGQTTRLSQAALETLAVIAYRQPVTRSAVAAIRGVNVDSVVRTLVTRGLLDTAGTDPVTGATLYVTTAEFLERLGLDSIDELPHLSPHLPGVEDLDEINDAAP